MNFWLDSVNIDEIKDVADHLPIRGITSNPSIVKQVSPDNFFTHMKEVKQALGPDSLVQVQVISTDYEGMLKEAKHITDELGLSTIIKVPATYEGVKAIRSLKRKDYFVTATAIYDQMQAFLALEAGADYIAPYFNRISNLGGDPVDLISNLAYHIDSGRYETEVLGASFKNLAQVKEALNAGAHAVTVQPGLLKQVFSNPNITKAVEDFNNDWYSMYKNNLQYLK